MDIDIKLHKDDLPEDYLPEDELLPADQLEDNFNMEAKKISQQILDLL